MQPGFSSSITWPWQKVVFKACSRGIHQSEVFDEESRVNPGYENSALSDEQELMAVGANSRPQLQPT
jgi:hypothetical protein